MQWNKLLHWYVQKRQFEQDWIQHPLPSIYSLPCTSLFMQTVYGKTTMLYSAEKQLHDNEFYRMEVLRKKLGVQRVTNGRNRKGKKDFKVVMWDEYKNFAQGCRVVRRIAQ